MEDSQEAQRDDIGGHGQPMAADDRKEPPMSSVTTKEAVLLFEDAAVPRSLRSIERYCKKGRLDAYLHPDEDTYYIDQESIIRLIKEFQQAQERRLNRTPASVATAVDSVDDSGGQVPPSAASENDGIENELKKKADEIFNLKIDVSAKAQVISIMRDQMETDRQVLVDTTRRLGQVEERLGISAPIQMEEDTVDEEETETKST